MGGGQMFVAVAEMVLTELAGEITLRFEQLGDGHVARLQTFFGAGQSDLQQARPKRRLSCEESGTPGGAALLAIPVSEHRAFFGEAINVRRFVTHLTVVIGGDVPPTDIVTPEDKNVGLLFALPRRSFGGGRVCGVGRGGRDDERQRGKNNGQGANEGFWFHFVRWWVVGKTRALCQGAP